MWNVIWVVLTIHICILECCRFGPGPNCGFPCRCTGDNQCDSESGKCAPKSKCQAVPPDGYGWGGNGCRLGNVAYKKSDVHQLGVYNDYTANLAVDGDTNPSITTFAKNTSESCAHPSSPKGSFSWWWIGLGDLYRIKSITIYNRLFKDGAPGPAEDELKGRSTHYDIKIGNTSDRAQQTLCFHQDKDASDIKPVEKMTCNSGDMVGRYVSFTRTEGWEPEDASICEFIVMGYKLIECHPVNCKSTCDPVVGCKTCAGGHMLPDCSKECPDGYWGVNCANKCGRCTAGNGCDKVTGSCGKKCEGWFIPDMCTKELGVPPTISSIKFTHVTPNEATVEWTIPKALYETKQYFYFVVSWKQNDVNITIWGTRDVNVSTNESILQCHLLELDYNTEYNVHITPYRKLNGLLEDGTRTNGNFRTLCPIAGPNTVYVIVAVVSGTVTLILIGIIIFLILRFRSFANAKDGRSLVRILSGKQNPIYVNTQVLDANNQNSHELNASLTLYESVDNTKPSRRAAAAEPESPETQAIYENTKPSDYEVVTRKNKHTPKAPEVYQKLNFA